MSALFTSDVQFLILRLLRDAPAGLYGLQMIEASRGKLKRGTIYVTLGRLEQKGLVKSRTQAGASHSGLPRPIYKITAVGERVLLAADFVTSGLAGAQFDV